MACGLRLKYALVGTAVGVSCLGAQSTPAKATAPSLPGLSYAAGDWNTKMPVDRRLVLLCYRLVPTNSAAQPYTLEPTDFRETDNDAEIKASWTKNKRSPCSVIDYKHPLLERRILAVAIDVRKWQGAEPNVTRLAVLNINVTTQPGTPLNPTPVRPSVATASITELNYGNSVYYLRWPIALVGDAIPTISINVVYIAPAPGESWHSNTVYAPGAVVTPGKRDGHFYGLLNEGRSTPIDSAHKPPHFVATSPATVQDSSPPAGSPLTWTDLGTTAPVGLSSPFSTWSPSRPFAAGAVIVNPVTGHFYAASTAGQSRAAMPALPVTQPASVADPADGGASGLTWMDLGTVAPPGTPASPPVWKRKSSLATGIVIFVPLNGHYYVASHGGTSGTELPSFPVTARATVQELPLGPITWTDVGPTVPAGSPSNIPQWTPNTIFITGQLITTPTTSRFYVASVGGMSGATPPVFPVTKPEQTAGDLHLLWQDMGTSVPSSVLTSGPTDQVVSLLNLTLPQVHSLYYFNLATGVAFSAAHNQTFVRQLQAPPSATTVPIPPWPSYVTQAVQGPATVEPIILLTWYLPGCAMDAESPFSPRDRIPGLSLGLSLASPATSFYAGISSEIFRNVQLAAGVNVAKVTALAPAGYVADTASAAPAIMQKFTSRFFVGLTLNIDFIAGLFGQKL